jgi:enoyl-CoA hydratase/carnithine racemase
MADYLVADSRSAMCFSEAMIGIIPGWGGVARVLTKAGVETAEYMAKTATPLNARELEKAGVFNEVVDVPLSLPRLQRTGNAEQDRRNYLIELEIHDEASGRLLLPKALDAATRQDRDIRAVHERVRKVRYTKDEISDEVARRVEPMNYRGLWGRPLTEVEKEIGKLGRPLAPQSIRAVTGLLETYNRDSYDEKRFVEAELEADAALYWDPLFPEGLRSMLEKRVPDFR